jgi:xanthine/CO dehydrogenase XdhC/CoxF family maturation factor
MGLSIGARTHEEIAVAVAAELVSFRRLGGPPEQPQRSAEGPRDPSCGPR